MKRFVIALALVVVAKVVVNGQEKSPHTQSAAKSAEQSKKEPSQSTLPQIEVNQQATNIENDRAENHSKSYLWRLFSPENLPNIGLFVVGVGGVIIGVCTLLSLKKQSADTHSQVVVLLRQVAEMRKSREIATKTLILQYRPRIVVRYIKPLNTTLEFGKESEMEIQITLVNKGGSIGHVQGGSVAFWSIERPDVGKIVAKQGTDVPLEPLSLQPGEAQRLQRSLRTGTLHNVAWANFHEGYKDSPARFLTLVGIVFYVDDLGIVRRTGFNRNYDPKTKSFVPGEPEEEYTD
jgi:hypothetical protein